MGARGLKPTTRNHDGGFRVALPALQLLNVRGNLNRVCREHKGWQEALSISRRKATAIAHPIGGIADSETQPTHLRPLGNPEPNEKRYKTGG